MPIDFSSFVFKPQPLQRWNIGEAFNDVIQGNRFRQQQAQQESQYARSRSDNQAFHATDLATKQATAGYDKEKARYASQVEAIDKARAAGQAGHWDVAEALAPGIKTLGGLAERLPDGSWRFKEGTAPTIGAPDIAGARRSMYGPTSPEASAPFQVPGFGPDGKRNPFDPMAMSGASAAAMPPPPGPTAMNQGPAPAGAAQTQPPAPSPTAGVDPDPPPGPARSAAPPGSVWLPPGMDPGTAPPPPAPTAGNEAPQQEQAPGGSPSSQDTTAPPQAQQPGSPQLSMSDDPYVINPAAVKLRNQGATEEYLKGMKLGFPDSYQDRISPILGAVGNLGYTPAESLKLLQPTYGTIAGMVRADINRQTAQASLGLRGQAMEFSQNQRLKDAAFKRFKEVGKTFDYDRHILKLQKLKEFRRLLNTPGSDAQAVALLHDMYEKGIMTDDDYSRAKQGIITWAQKAKNGIYEGFVNNGLSPDARSNMRGLADAAEASAKENIADTQKQMLNRNLNNRTSSPEEFAEYVSLTSDSVPRELWSDELKGYMKMPVAQKSGPVDAAGNYAVRPSSGAHPPRAPDAGSGDLGVVPLPGAGGNKTISGITFSLANKTVTIGGKTKKVEDLTDKEMDSLPLEVLRELMPKPEEDQ